MSGNKRYVDVRAIIPGILFGISSFIVIVNAAMASQVFLNYELEGVVAYLFHLLMFLPASFIAGYLTTKGQSILNAICTTGILFASIWGAGWVCGMHSLTSPSPLSKLMFMTIEVVVIGGVGGVVGKKLREIKER